MSVQLTSHGRALQGDKQGLVRCKDAAAATSLLERDGSTATIGGQAAKLRLLEGAPHAFAGLAMRLGQDIEVGVISACFAAQ